MHLPTLRWTAAAGLLLVLALPLGAAGALLPELGEFQVNTQTSLNQAQAAVAAAPDGRFVVVWQSATSPGTDTSDFSIQARRFDPAGTPIGAQFQVNSYTTTTQSVPDVAVALDGSFTVVWQSFGAPAGGDAALFGIRARGFHADGTEKFGEMQVNQFTIGDQIRPSVASVLGAELVFAWQTSATVAPDGDGSASSIQARRFNASGAPLGSQFLVDTTTSGFQTEPEVSPDGVGGFAVVWASDDDPSGSALFRLRGRRYTAGGVPTSEFLIDDSLVDEGAPSIGHSASGFVVAWQATTADGAGRGVRARRYDTSGQPIGAAWTVNDVTSGDQVLPSVAVFPSGDFVVSWQSDTSAGPDTSSHSVQAKLYDRTGSPTGGQFQVNLFSGSGQDAPSLAIARNTGRLIAAWESNGSFGGDNSLLSIQGETWIDSRLIFSDDFESGDTAAWSDSSP